MVRASATGKSGEPVILIGITVADIFQLMEDNKIFFDATGYGLPGWICLFFGATDDAISAELVLAEAALIIENQN